MVLYSWRLQGFEVSTSQFPNNLPNPGTYTVIVTDGDGCTASDTHTVSSCGSQCSNCEIINETVNGCQVSFGYQGCEDAGDIINLILDNNNSFSAAKDPSGTGTATFTVTGDGVYTAQIINDSPCFGASSQIAVDSCETVCGDCQISATVSGCDINVQYSNCGDALQEITLNDSSNNILQSQAIQASGSASFTVTQDGTYNVVISAGDNCPGDSQSVTVDNCNSCYYGPSIGDHTLGITGFNCFAQQLQFTLSQGINYGPIECIGGCCTDFGGTITVTNYELVNVTNGNTLRDFGTGGSSSFDCGDTTSFPGSLPVTCTELSDSSTFLGDILEFRHQITLSNTNCTDSSVDLGPFEAVGTITVTQEMLDCCN